MAGTVSSVPPSCAGVMDQNSQCCPGGVLSVSGVCCQHGAVLDAAGYCCNSGLLDVCGTCGGFAWTVDLV
eukprot:gene14763-14937_t